MKKILTTVIVFCLLAAGCLAIFAACGSSGDPNHTIYFHTQQGNNLVSVTDEAIASFEEKYPGWTVEHTHAGGYDDVLNKVRSDLTAGTQPDLAYCYSDHVAQYLSSGKVVDMNKYLLNDASYEYAYADENGAAQSKTIERIGFTQSDVDSFVQGYFDEGKISNYTLPQGVSMDEDAIVTLPFIKSTELLYYNPDALRTLGYLEPPTTWAELWQICEEAKDMWPTCTPLGYDSEANWFITMAAQKGFDYTSPDESNHYLFNNPGAIAWLNEIKGYYDKGYIITQQLYGGTYTSGLFTKGPAAGGLVFCIGSSGGASNQAGIDFNTEVAPIPGVDATHNQCISQGPSLVMLTGGRNPANASEKEIMTFQFVKELLAADFQATFARASGYNPMRTDVYDNEEFAMWLDGKDPDKNGAPLTGANLVKAKASAAGRQLSNRFFVSPAFVGSSTARSQVQSVVQYVLLGQRTAQEALAEAYKNCGGK